MKKIFAIAIAVCVGLVAQSQIVTGIQGGYNTVKETNTLNADFVTSNTILGGATIGYMVMPKLMVAVSFNYYRFDDVNLTATDSIDRGGMRHKVTNHQFKSNRTGWTLSPQVRYEVLRYGNMKFNLLLQGTYGKMGKSSSIESYNSWQNNGELINEAEVIGNNTVTKLDINLRPTLSYEFSEHLSAELSLDLLSVGFLKQTVSFDPELDASGNETTPAHDNVTTQIYGGINTFRDAIYWESSLLRLGFYYKF